MKKLLQLGIIIIASNVYSQSGSLDSIFGTGGKVITSIKIGADKAYAVAFEEKSDFSISSTVVFTSFGAFS